MKQEHQMNLLPRWGYKMEHKNKEMKKRHDSMQKIANEHKSMHKKKKKMMMEDE